MPIHCVLPVRSLRADEFEQRDYRVMGHAYACQNELGRLCDEGVYEADLKARLLAEGFHEVHTQVPVTVTHDSFSKTYYLDLIADDALYELKTNKALTGEAPRRGSLPKNSLAPIPMPTLCRPATFRMRWPGLRTTSVPLH